MLKCGHEYANVAPPSWLTAATRPCAPPSDQRSCCQNPAISSGSAGLTASHGSTSLFGKLKLTPGKLPSVGPPQPGGNGVEMLIEVGGATVSGPAAAGDVPTAANTAAAPSARTMRRMSSPPFCRRSPAASTLAGGRACESYCPSRRSPNAVFARLAARLHRDRRSRASPQRALAHGARAHALRVVADLDAGDLPGGPERDHRDAVVAGDRDEAVTPVPARRGPVRHPSDRDDPLRRQ